MALSCTPESLAVASSCFNCVPDGDKLNLVIYLLQQQIPSMATLTANQLAIAAKQFQAIPDGLKWNVIIYLLCSGAGGGGGSTCGNYGGAKPPASAAPSSGCGSVIDTSNARIWWY